jgi:hypothetical protein
MKYRLTIAAMLLLPLMACEDDDDDGTGPETGTASLRIVNAADVADVQARVVGTTAQLVTDLDFREVTQTCVEVPEGEHAIVFGTPSAGDLATAVATFEEDESYTAFFVVSGGFRRAVILPDTVTASTGNNALRFVNGTTSAGDVYVTPPNGAIGPAFLASGNLSMLAATNDVPGYLHRSTDHTQVRLFNSGTTTGTPRADIALTGLPTSRLASVVFTNAGTPAGPTAFLVTPCP